MGAVAESLPNATIDFLPDRFREQDAQRKVQSWRLVTIGLLMIALPVASFAQFRIHRSIQSEINGLNSKYAVTEQDTLRLQAVEANLRNEECTARLLTYLRHPWPRSQVLSALLPALPESVTLVSIQLEAVGGPTNVPNPAARNLHQEGEPDAAAALRPTERDLKAIRTRHDKGAIELIVSGVSSDPAQLHSYLGELSRTRLFAKAELISLESIASTGAKAADSPKDVRFRARLELSPGYGQSKGPQASQNNSPVTHAMPVSTGDHS